MKTLQTLLFVLGSIFMLGIGTSSAGTGHQSTMPSYHGHMGMMGDGAAHVPGHGHAWMGYRSGPMTGPGHGCMAYGPGHMMGHGHGPMPGYRHGPMMLLDRGGMWGNARVDPDQLSDELLDRMSERMAEHHRVMQEIASDQDQAARRELLRKHLKSMQFGGEDQQRNESSKDQGQSARRGQGQGGMMGQGGMGEGMMGPGMMGQGMMSTPELSDEQLDRLGTHMAESYRRMEQIAGTTDKAERRELLREHFESMHQFMGNMHQRR